MRVTDMKMITFTLMLLNLNKTLQFTWNKEKSGRKIFHFNYELPGSSAVPNGMPLIYPQIKVTF